MRYIYTRGCYINFPLVRDIRGVESFLRGGRYSFRSVGLICRRVRIVVPIRRYIVRGFGLGGDALWNVGCLACDKSLTVMRGKGVVGDSLSSNDREISRSKYTFKCTLVTV